MNLAEIFKTQGDLKSATKFMNKGISYNHSNIELRRERDSLLQNTNNCNVNYKTTDFS